MKKISAWLTLFVGGILGFAFAILLVSLGEPDSYDTVNSTSINAPKALEKFLENLSDLKEEEIKSFDDLSATRDKISSAVNQLPAPRRQALADQIALAEWSLNALDLLSEETLSSELISQIILAQTLTESVPLSVPSGLEATVQKRAETLTDRAEKQIAQLAEANPIADLESLREGALLANVMAQAGLLEDPTAANRLEILLQVTEWENNMNQLKRETYGSKEEFDLAQYNLVEEGSAVVELAVNLKVKLPSGFIPSLHNYSKSLAEEQRHAQEKIRADYQIWAIGQIEEANKMIADTGADNISKWLKEAEDHPKNEYFQLLNYAKEDRAPKFRKELLTSANKEGASTTTVNRYSLPIIVKSLRGMTSWKGQSEMAKALTADALLLYLMPVDEALLDRPVAALYSEAFQKAWNYLEGTDYRMEVAKEGVAISRKQLSE